MWVSSVLFSTTLYLGETVPELENDHNHTLPLELKWPITKCDFLVVLCVSKFKIGYKIRKWCQERTYWQSSISILNICFGQNSLKKLQVNILKICQDSCEYLVTLHLVTWQQWHKHLSFNVTEFPSYHHCMLEAKAKKISSNSSLSTLLWKLEVAKCKQHLWYNCNCSFVF